MTERNGHFTIGDALVALIVFVATNPIAWLLGVAAIVMFTHRACP